jgi:O-acetyl-ADP-ribose deacetylase (regulator of RNase III)
MMEKKMARLRALQADITTLPVAAVVNAANSMLLGGGGVDGAIHRAAGPQLLEECRRLGGCPTGEARITRGWNLPADWVIHTVGPVWRGGERGEPELLAACYRNSLKLAADYDLESLAFPCISTGVYRYPPAAAAEIAVATVRESLARRPSALREVIFCCFSSDSLAVYERLLAESG